MITGCASMMSRPGFIAEWIVISDHRNEKLSWRVQRLYAADPRRWISVYRDRVSGCMETLIQHKLNQLNTKRMKLQMLNGRLHALSPAAVLDRGFSIARLLPGKTIITDARNIDEGRLIEILFAREA
jgi:exodeoxyribonuclease VII large subunit